MRYICHKRYDKTGADEKRHIIRRKTRLESIAGFIAEGSSAVCRITSEDARRHFARDDDGKGLERGRLSWKIAYAPRHPNEDNEFRFTPGEIEMLRKDYGRFLEDDKDVILFNSDFFHAEISELEEILERLEADGCTW